jgi:hypothetical protein
MATANPNQGDHLILIPDIMRRALRKMAFANRAALELPPVPVDLSSNLYRNSLLEKNQG